MTISKQIIEILNNDKKVQNFMRTAAKAAENTGMTEEEWNGAKESLMCMSIQMCPEAMSALSDAAYEDLRGQN